MKRFFKPLYKVALVMMAALFIIASSGCTDNITKKAQESEPQKSTYNMNNALDAAQYSNFMNKELNAVINQISSQLNTSQQASMGSFDTSEAIRSIENSIETIKEAKHQIDIMIPPDQYARNRKNVLNLMDNTINDLNKLKEALSNNDTKSVANVRSSLMGDFSTLTAEFNVYYK